MFFQLGQVAARRRRWADGGRLAALRCLSDRDLQHPDAASDYQALRGMAAALGYTAERLEAMVGEVGRADAAGRGRALVAAAFGNAR